MLHPRIRNPPAFWQKPATILGLLRYSGVDFGPVSAKLVQKRGAFALTKKAGTAPGLSHFSYARFFFLNMPRR